MKDPSFIAAMLTKGREAGIKVKNELEHLSLEQLNWKPIPDKWSAGQCLDHLIVTDCLYFPTLKKITEHKFTMTWWQRWSPLSGLFGKILVTQLDEQTKRKVKTAKMFLPSESEIDAGIMERFHKHLDTLLEYIGALTDVDLDKTFIASPISKFITYSLRNAVKLMVQHEHRHINQAIRTIKQLNDSSLRSE